MILPDFLRLRLALGADREPDRSPKRFAPYPVWALARIMAVVGYLCFPLSMVFFLLDWMTPGLLTLILGVVIILPLPRDEISALTPEIVSNLLGSRYCPAYGQSIFDRAGPSGYMPDSARGTWWPHRHCANCEHDLKVRTHD